MANALPTFQGYTVDVRLKEFRKVYKTKPMVFISFDSPEGEGLLAAWIKTLPQSEFLKVASHLF